MRVNMKDLASAVDKITTLTSVDKNIPGVLLDVKEDSLHVCYHDSRKALIEKIDAEVDVESGDRLGPIVVDYVQLEGVLSGLRPTGRIAVNYIDITFEDNNMIKIAADKTLRVVYEDGESEEQIVAHSQQLLKWYEPNENMKVAILSRFEYDSIFEPEQVKEGEEQPSVDEWTVGEFRQAIGGVSREDKNIMYLAANGKSAFVSADAYLSRVDLEKEFTNSLVLPTATSKSVYDILGGFKANDTIYIYSKDNQYCYIYTQDEKLGLWMTMAKANPMHINMLERYQDKEYNKYQITIVKEALENAVKAAMGVDKTDKTVIKFNRDEDSDLINLVIERKSTLSSISNVYNVICSGVLDADGDIESAELPVSLKVLSDLINKCGTDYIALDISEDGGSKILRTAEIDFNTKLELDDEARLELGLSEDDELPTERQLAHREGYLGFTNYTILAR